MWIELIEKLKAEPTVSVPEAGKALADLSRNGSYQAAREGKLGVRVLEIGGRRRVPSIEVLRALGLEKAGAA